MYRMRGHTQDAILTIETALAKGTTFRQADSLLVFEVSLEEPLGSIGSELTRATLLRCSYHGAILAREWRSRPPIAFCGCNSSHLGPTLPISLSLLEVC